MVEGLWCPLVSFVNLQEQCKLTWIFLTVDVSFSCSLLKLPWAQTEEVCTYWIEIIVWCNVVISREKKKINFKNQNTPWIDDLKVWCSMICSCGKRWKVFFIPITVCIKTFHTDFYRKIQGNSSEKKSKRVKRLAPRTHKDVRTYDNFRLANANEYLYRMLELYQGVLLKWIFVCLAFFIHN